MPFMAFFLAAVGASAGVFRIFAGWAVAEVEGELFDHCLGVRRGFDLDDDWQVVAFRKRDVGDERVAVLGEAHAGRVRAAAAGDSDALLAERNGFARVIDRCDLHLAVRGDKELKVGLDAGEDATAVRAGDLLGLISVFVIRMFLVIGVVMILFGQDGACETDYEGRRKGGEVLVCFCFHGFQLGFCCWVMDQTEALVSWRIDLSEALRPKRK